MDDFNYNNIGKAQYIKLQENSVDPDAKIKMSLDDIIQIYGPGGRKRVVKRRPINANLTRNFKRAPAYRVQSTFGGSYFVSKNSPLMRRNLMRNREIEIRAAQAQMNRALNAPILNEKEEIIPAMYKLIRTKNGVQRILVPAVTSKPMPTLKVPLPRKPMLKYNKNRPPPLVEKSISVSDFSTTGSVKSFKSTKSIKSMQSVRSFKSSLSSRLGPPPLVEMSHNGGPPPLVERSFSQGPPPLVVKTINSSQPPPLVESKNFHVKTPSIASSNLRFSQPPPLVDTRNSINPPPLIDLGDDDDFDDVEMKDLKPPPLVPASSRSKFLSLNERFSNFYN